MSDKKAIQRYVNIPYAGITLVTAITTCETHHSSIALL